jgi:predicted ATPase
MKSLLTEIQIRNYKNIATAVIPLRPLTVLVGPNGAGKSNLVDSLAFVADCLNHSIQLAFANRGGISAVRRKSGGHPTHIGIRLRLDLGNSSWADYAFDIAARPREAFTVARERCTVQTLLKPQQVFEVENGRFVQEVPGIRSRVEPDRLALTVLSAAEEFRPVFDFLTGIRRYSLRPERIRELQDPDPGEGLVLLPDGSNAAAVLRQISEDGPDSKSVYQRICHLLGEIVPGTTGVLPKALGQKETLEFVQNVGQKYGWHFDALNMSDGTLRALGILLAVYQPKPASLLAVEEPEGTIHPAVTEILTDVLIDGANRSQILITTHSPDVLDNKRLSDEQLAVVESVQGVALVTPMNATSREAVRQRLYTTGELLRQGELHTDHSYAAEKSRQLDLFGPADRS